MPIPDFQTLMLPVLRHVGDGSSHSFASVVDAMRKEFLLTDEEMAIQLPSGRAPLFYNRVAWAKTYLKRAGLIDQIKRGELHISPSGQAELAKHPIKIDLRYLQTISPIASVPAVEETANDATLMNSSSGANEATPEETLDRAFGEIESALKNELIEIIKKCPPLFFEKLVIQLLLRMGYGGSRQEAARAVGKTGDGGIDGIINEDRLGLDAIYIQAKRWEGSVGSGVIRDFKGALDRKRAQKGVIITTSSFTPSAVQEAEDSRSYKIVLIDGDRLAKLMVEHNLGVSTAETYQIKRIDLEFFADD